MERARSGVGSKFVVAPDTEREKKAGMAMNSLPDPCLLDFRRVVDVLTAYNSMKMIGIHM
jgi:hypothetical protein